MADNMLAVSKTVKLKKNALVFLGILVVLVVLFSARGLILPGSKTSSGITRDVQARNAIGIANRRILATVSASPALKGENYWGSRENRYKYPERIGPRIGLDQVRAPKEPERPEGELDVIRRNQPRTTIGPFVKTGKFTDELRLTVPPPKPLNAGGDSVVTTKSSQTRGGWRGLSKPWDAVTALKQKLLGQKDNMGSQEMSANKTKVEEQGYKRNAGFQDSTGNTRQMLTPGIGEQIPRKRIGPVGNMNEQGALPNQRFGGQTGQSVDRPRSTGIRGGVIDQGFAAAQRKPENQSMPSSASGKPMEGMKFYDGSGKLVESHPNWIVVTSIQGPTDDVKALSKLPGWKVVVIGDTKTPKGWSYPNVVYLDVETQMKLGFKALEFIPTKSYARKNIGYYFAIKYGAKTIYDTDDDNKPNDGFRSFTFEDSKTTTILVVRNANKTYNPYPHFGQQSIWPRGYPLEDVSKDVPRDYYLCETTTPLIRQGIVNGDPDVDAIFRLLHKHASKRINVLFDVGAPRVAIPPKIYTPYNSQNTISHYGAFWALAFPVTPSFRVCDIWRSYWAQRLAWMIGTQVGFYTAGTFQFRSAHSYIKDFIDEKQLYHQAGDLVKFLDKWECKSKVFFECVKAMSHDMAAANFWSERDAQFVDAWLQDLLALGYSPPSLRPISSQQCVNNPTNVIFYPQEQLATYGEVPTYYLPPFVRSKFDALGNIVKASCPKITNPSTEVSLNGSSLINNILLIIHLEGVPVPDLVARLEVFYRPRFGQILYCGKWRDTVKPIFHMWRASYAEIAGTSGDPQMECLYKAADMHYIVDGYMVIHQRTLFNMNSMKKNKGSLWVTENWATTSETSQCLDASCANVEINVETANKIVTGGTNINTLSTCKFNKPGVRFNYLKDRVFFVPSVFDRYLRLASKASLEGVSMSAWLQCVSNNPITLKKSQDLKTANVYTDFVQKFDFTDMNNLCPVLGFNP